MPEKVLEAILRLVRSARPEQTDNQQVKKRVDWGPSPRAGQSLMLAARFRKPWPIAWGILAATLANHALAADRKSVV